jgi:site-specific DNA-methyltransferase (adenine-specific)
MVRPTTPDILAQAGQGSDDVALAMGPQVSALDIAVIRLDGGTQPRAALDWTVIQEYAEAMQAGVRFPAVTVVYDGQAHWLVDGFHRVNAAQQAKLATIPADVKPGTLQDAQWLSYGVNTSHGLRRSNEDKRRAVEAALAHPKAEGRSNVQIAAHCGVSEFMVRQHRPAPAIFDKIEDSEQPAERIVTRGDSTYTMQTGNIGKEKPVNLEIWQIEQFLRHYLKAHLQPEHHADLLSKLDKWEYRETVTQWIKAEHPGASWRGRDMIQAANNILEQMRQAGLFERRPAKPQPAPEPWDVMVLVEELLALQSVALDGVDDAWLYEYMESQGKRTNRTLDRRTFDDALPQAVRRQIADNERRQRLETSRAAAIAADQERKPAALDWTDKTIGDVTIWRADSRQLPADIRDVDLVITSPPYNVGIEYSEHFDKMKQEQYIELLHGVFTGCHQVMRHGARLAVVVPFGVGRNPWQPLSLFVAQYIQKAGFTLRGQIVWDKGSSGNRTSWGSFRSPSDPSLRDTTECILVAHKTQSGAQVPTNVLRRDDKGPHSPWLESSDYFMELAQDHWTVAPESAQRIGHPAPFPVELVKRLVHFYGWPGCTLLDPFGGSGTVGVAAAQLDCTAHLVDIDAAYCALAARRVEAAYAGRQMLEER